jgi:hypothetical protein
MVQRRHTTLVRFSGLPGLAIYVGIGALLHAIFHSPQFDWSSAWTWGWLLGWPFMIFVAFWAVILGVALLGTAAAVLVALARR